MREKILEDSKSLKYREITMISGTKKRIYEGVNFETWSSKVALYFEMQSDSPVKARVLDKYSRLASDNSDEFFNIATGALLAMGEE